MHRRFAEGRALRLAGLFAILCCASVAGAQTIVYVDADAPAKGDGTSWATAYRTLQDALADPLLDMPPVQVWVAEGTYRPDDGGDETLGDAAATFAMRTGVAIFGGFFGNEIALDERDLMLHPTVLSGELVSDRSHHVVTSTGHGATAVLDGFIVTGGLSDALGAFPSRAGAGLLVEGGAPTIDNCRFVGNLAVNQGGAVAVLGGAVPSFANCAFVANDAAQGGAIYVSTGGVDLRNCTFTENTSTESAAIRLLTGTTATIANSIVWANHALDGIALGGPGSYVVDYSNVEGGGVVGTGNIDADPLIADVDGMDDLLGTADDDVRLSPGSPCNDAGDNASVPMGVVFDLDSNPRFLDDTLAIDTGDAAGMPPVVDMGPYEFDVFALAEHVFVGGPGALWTDPASWSKGVVPAASDDVLIGGAVTIPAGAAVAARSVVLFPGADLRIAAEAGTPGGTLATTDLEIRTGATLTLEIAGDPASGSFGSVQVSGTATLGGTIAVELVGGYEPPADATYELVRLVGAGVLDGVFDETELRIPAGQNPPQVTYQPQGVVLVFGVTVVFVDASADPGGDGSSWESALRSLQDALDAAASLVAAGRVEVWLSGGTYRPDEGVGRTPGDRSLSFGMLSGVTVRGHFAGTEASVAERDLSNPSSRTILSGEIGDPADRTDNAYHVVRFDAQDATAVLEAVTIEDGFANAGDGDVSILRNDGNDVFSTLAPVPIGGRPVGIAAARLSEGDGTYDLVVSRDGDETDDDAFVFAFGGGDGTFGGASAVVLPPLPPGLPRMPRRADPADLDNEKDGFVAAALDGADQVALLERTGPTTFALTGLLDADTGTFDVAVQDLDGDGDGEIVSVNRDAGSITVFRNDAAVGGPATFAPPVNLPVGTDARAIVAVDLDGDMSGDADLAVLVDGDVTPELRILRNDTDLGGGGILLAPAEEQSVGAGAILLESGQLDGDGDADLVTIEGGGGGPFPLGPPGALGLAKVTRNATVQPLVGACCLDPGCVSLTEPECTVMGGTWIAGDCADACTPPCPSDLDADGETGFSDLLVLLSAWGGTGGDEDLDGDGLVGFGDLLILLSAYGPCAS